MPKRRNAGRFRKAEGIGEIRRGDPGGAPPDKRDRECLKERAA